MNIEQTIIHLASIKTRFTTAGVLQALNHSVSRQAVALILKHLVASGRLIKGGSTRNSFYLLPKNIDKIGERISKELANKNLEEHEVFSGLREQSPAIRNLPENVFSIVQYAFDEMLNNAIEHSGSKKILMKIHEVKGIMTFEIKDVGIGVFRNIMHNRHLQSELEAIQDLLKGKTTTAPQAHSGQGIFFTSKAMDIFILESFGWRLRIDNNIRDIFIEEIKSTDRGTRVTCSMTTNSSRHLNDVFAAYQTKPGEFGFDKTEVHIRLFTMGTVYISRSQARRVLVGLDKFKSIVMDFDKVPTVGQAFADEIFRVFKLQHPTIEIVPINMNKAVSFMVGRVEKPKL